MRHRLRTTVFLWAIIVAAVVIGKLLGGQIILLLISLGVLWELATLVKKLGVPLNPPALLIGLTFALGGHLWGMASVGTSLGLITIILAHWRADARALPIGILCVLTVALGMGSLSAIAQRADPNALWQALWVIAVIKLSDGGGYLFGRHFGRHKLAPKISPSKTIEGLIGSIFSGLLIGILGEPLFPVAYFAPVLSVLLAILGATGDLLESFLKRKACVKDSGHILPGIGGLLDLCDSLIVAAPVAYLCIRFLA